MKRTLRLLSALAMTLMSFASSVWAQTSFEGKVSSPSNSWGISDVTYNMSEIATALGYADASALATAFDAQEVIISAPDAEGNLSSTPTSYYTRGDVENYSYGCFWLNNKGKIVATWNAEGVAFANHFDYDDSNIIIHLMQNTAEKTTPGDYTAVITLAANEKVVTLSSTLTIDALPPFPTPVRNIADLDVVDVVTVGVSQPVMTNWGTNPSFTVDATALVEAAEANETVMAANASKMLGVQVWDATAGAASNVLFVGKEDSDFTANGGGYWFKRGIEGNPNLYKSEWGAGPDIFIENISYDPETHQFKGSAGQMINKFALGDQFAFNVYFIYGDQAIKAEFIFTVKEDENATVIPEPITEIALLNIVETIKAEVTQPIMKNWGTNPVWRVDGSKLVEACGVEPAIFASNINKMVYAQMWDSNAEDVSEQTSATGAFTANAPGYWFAHASIVDEETDELIPTENCYVGSYGSSDFFTEYIAFDAETQEFYGAAGQMINKFKGGEHFKAVLYFIYGDKVLQVDLHFNVEKPADIDVADMVQVGETATMTWTQEPRTDYTGNEHWVADMNNVSTLLGCASNAMVLKCKLADGTVTDKYTTSTTSVENGIFGFWIDENGTPIASNADVKSFYVEYNAGKGSFTLGQKPNTFAVGDKFTATLWLCNNEKYYELSINLNIEDLQKVEQADYREVGSYSFNFQSIVDGSWDLTENMGEPLNMTEVQDKLGTEDFVVYAISDGVFTTGYTCTPYPGFWFSPDGTKVVGWGSAKVGMIYSRDHIQMFKNPTKHEDNPEADTNVGDKLTHSIYLVNEYTGAYVTITANVTFVEKIVKYQITGEKDFAVEMDEKGVGTMEFDGKEVVRMIATNMGNFWEKGFILPLKGEKEYAQPNEFANGDELKFDADGHVLPADAETFAFKITPEMDEVVGSRLYVDGILPEGVIVPEDGIVYKTDLVFQYDEYRYIMHIQVKFPLATSINGIKTSTNDKQNIFNLNGQRVGIPTKGIYIINGKKTLVK